jgi:Tfp pilus assembly protein PilP
MTRAAPTCAALLVALVLAGCGESDEDKAQAAVCDARADISKQIDDLKGMTAATFSTDAVSGSLSAIQTDLSKIKSAQGDLSDDRRQQVQSANQAFESQISGIVKQIGSSASVADAETQVTASLQQLADSYQQTYARIDCD